MTHSTRVGGTDYQIVGGNTRAGGTDYTISGGKTRVGGTDYKISFAPPTLTIEQLFASVTGVFPKNDQGRQIVDIPASNTPYYVFAVANGYVSIREFTCDGSQTTLVNSYGSTQTVVKTTAVTSAPRVNLDSSAYNYAFFALQFSANNDSIRTLLSALSQTRQAYRMNTGTSGGAVSCTPFSGYAFVHGAGSISSEKRIAFAVDSVTSSGAFTNIYSLGYKEVSGAYGDIFTVSNKSLLRYYNSKFYVSQTGSTNWTCYGASIIQVSA